MITFDMRTIILSYVISNAICAFVMTVLWLQSRKQVAGLGFWMAGYILNFLSILLISLRGILPDLFSIVLGNSLLLTGMLLIYIGLEQYVGKTSSQLHNVILLAVFTVIHAYFTFIQPSLLARTLNVALGLLIICSQCSWLMLKRTDPKMWPGTRRFGIICLTYGLIGIGEFVLQLFIPAGNEFFRTDILNTLAVLIFQMMFIVLTFTLFLMVSRRFRADLEEDIAERKLAEEALKISEEKFSIAFQNHPDAIVITSIIDGRIIEANESFFRMTGYSKAETIGKTTIELKLWARPQDRNKFVELLQKTGRVLNYEATFRKKKGALFAGWISSGIIRIQKVDYVLTVIHDVSGRKAIEEVLRLDGLMMANISDGIFLYKASDGKIVYANPQFEKLFGYEPDELIGKPVSVLNAPAEKTPEAVANEIIKSLKKNNSWDGEIQNIKKDGTCFWSHASISSFKHSEYGLVWVTVQQDVTKRKQAETKLEYLSTHDSLTGLYNRSFFDEEMRRFERGRQFPISIVMVDVDGLKVINDDQGHPAGDRLLQRTAKVLNDSFRADDIVARIGGDEFAALLPKTDEIAARESLKRICSNLQKNNDAENGNVLSISLGISTAEKGKELKSKLQQADKNMYQEKSGKKMNGH